jgi:hypothetical protein
MKAQDAIEKRLKPTKSGARLVAVVAVATVIVVFSLVSARALLSQVTYNKRVLDARRDALNQLERNVEAAQSLVDQYQVFQTGNPTNIIGGKNSTDPNLQPPDGDNARLVLNSLPAKYDFPALISSIAKILNLNSISNQSITAKDESASVKTDPTTQPATTTITATVTGTSNYNAVKNLIHDIERSIRPFDVTKIEIKGSEGNMTVTLTINTYVQPALSLDLATKEVR